MQQDKGGQENWDKLHKKALYWCQDEAVVLKSPHETRVPSYELFTQKIINNKDSKIISPEHGVLEQKQIKKKKQNTPIKGSLPLITKLNSPVSTLVQVPSMEELSDDDDEDGDLFCLS